VCEGVHVLYFLLVCSCFLCLFDGLVFVESFIESYYFVQLVILTSILFSFLIGVNGKKCILVMWNLKAAILCSMG
jgi:hypothetical protein